MASRIQTGLHRCQEAGPSLHLQVVNKLMIFIGCVDFESCFRVWLVVGNNVCGINGHMPKGSYYGVLVKIE